MKLSRAGILLSAIPSVAMLALFYSLAIHMRYSLGAWPTSIGSRGFPPGLVTHECLTWLFCAALAAVSAYAVPVAILLCLFFKHWRRFIVYFVLYALLYALCWGLMLLAPAPFLHWWWD